MEKLISVIVPVYNAERFLEKCVSSIAEQSYRNLEILLIDDGSTDGSLALCQRLAKADSRIRVFSKENGGVASARNLGLRNMTGDWFMTMDADDYMGDGAVQALLHAVKKNQADIGIGGIELFWPDTKSDPRRIPEDWAGSLEEFTNQLLIPLFDLQLIHNQNNKLYRASNAVYYDESMSINEDVWFSVRMLSRCSRVAVTTEIVMFYRQHSSGESLVSRFYKNGVDTCLTLLKAVENLLKRGKAGASVRNDMYNRMVFHICGFAGLAYYRSGYSLGQCFLEIRRLLDRPEFIRLLARVKPRGIKNTLAVFVLRRRLAAVYHLMCLALYGRQRREYFRCRKGTIR